MSLQSQTLVKRQNKKTKNKKQTHLLSGKEKVPSTAVSKEHLEHERTH